MASLPGIASSLIVACSVVQVSAVQLKTSNRAVQQADLSSNTDELIATHSVSLVDGSAGGEMYMPQGYMPAEGFSHLIRQFSAPYSFNRLTRQIEGLPSAGFNPSIVILPKDIAHRLHPLARYAVTLRHTGDQCGNLGSGERKLRQGSAGSSIILLDESLQGLKAARILSEDGQVSDGEDVRLFVHGSKLLASLMTYPGIDGGVWHVKELHLDLHANSSLKAWYQSLETPIQYDGVRNLGIMQGSAKELVALWNLGTDMDVRPLISFSQVRDGKGTGAIHNSIHPIELAEENAFLTIGHEHLADSQPGPDFDPSDWDQPFYGSKYIQYFVLFDRSPPYSIQHVSQPFCLPSMHDNATCEVIQFIGAAILESDDLSLAYGINDCEASIMRISLSEVLSFTRKNGRAFESQSAS